MREWIVRCLFLTAAALAVWGGFRRRGGDVCLLAAAVGTVLGILAGLLAGMTADALLTPVLAVFAAAWVSLRFGKRDGDG